MDLRGKFVLRQKLECKPGNLCKSQITQRYLREGKIDVLGAQDSGWGLEEELHTLPICKISNNLDLAVKD